MSTARQQLMSTAVTYAPAASRPAITAMSARENPLTVRDWWRICGVAPDPRYGRQRGRQRARLCCGRTSDLCASERSTGRLLSCECSRYPSRRFDRHLQYVLRPALMLQVPGFSGYSPANASQMLLSTAAVVCTDTGIQPATKALSPASGPEESGPPAFRRASPRGCGWSSASRRL